ncbi:DUF433 domain-containing protein [Patescibacteria group bacterium]|nr:DUF433 domain-containing protein [Patescibacteria group bacterium]
MKNQKCFPNSRVPVRYLKEYFREGFSIKDFLKSYPWLNKEDVEKEAKRIRK